MVDEEYRSMSQERYSRTAMLLHWLIAAALAFQFGLGEAMEDAPPGPQAFDIVQFHKAFGMTILLLTVIRVAIRFSRPRPAVMADAGWAQKLAGAVHWGLYAIMILAPLSGWLAASTGRISVPVDMFGLFHWPDFPGVAGMEAGARHDLHELGETIHGVLAKAMLGLFLLHIAGALRHQYLLRQPTIERMLPGSRTLSPVGGSVHILLLAVLIVGFMVWGRQGPAPKGDPAILKSVMEQRAALEAAKSGEPDGEAEEHETE
jgi:cytochrome b561